MDWFVLRFCDWSEEWRLCHAAWLCICTANRRRTARAWGGNILLQCMSFGEIVKSVLKSWCFAISTWFHPFSIFFQTIQHVKHVLTRKIIWFYESKRDFNNIDNDHIKIPNLALGPKAYLINCSFFSKNQDWGKEMKKSHIYFIKKIHFTL